MATAVATMTEQELLNNVIDLAHLFRWLAMHPRPARTSHGWRTAIQGDAGYFDLTLVNAGQGRILAAELKSARGKLASDQVEWRDAWLTAGGEYYEWRPTDWASGAIERVLRGRS
jgi:hypothetical protein